MHTDSGSDANSGPGASGAVDPGHGAPGHGAPGHVAPGHVAPGHVAPGHVGNERPTPARRLTLASDRSLRVALRASFCALHSYALWQCQRADADPAAAVHEFRKTIRRLRALVRLLRPACGKDAARRLDGRLRSAARATSGLRDQRILLGALRHSGGTEHELARATLERRWQAEIVELEASGRERTALEACATRLESIDRELEEALPEEITTGDLTPALRRTYRRARRARGAVLNRMRENAVHTWRKRVKELRYQLELLAGLPAPCIESVHESMVNLAQGLGEVTDLYVLARHIGREDQGEPFEEAGELRRSIRRQARRDVASWLEQSASWFEMGSRRFAASLLEPALARHPAVSEPARAGPASSVPPSASRTGGNPA